MQNQANYYQPSGNFNALGFILALFICLAFSVLIAYAYTLISTFSPIIYLNVLLTIFFGIAIGAFVNTVSWLTHLRNELSRYILTVLTALLSIYLSWVAFTLYAAIGRMPSFSNLYLDNLGMIADKKAFFGVIGAINEVGLWEVFGLPFNGIILSFIWLLEILLILGAAVYYVYKNPMKPYAELEKKWYDKYTLNEAFSSIGSAPDLLVPKLLEDATVALQELGIGDAWKYAKVILYYLPNAKVQYLSLERVYIEGKGEGKTESETIIQYLTIDTAAAKKLMETYTHEKAGWL